MGNICLSGGWSLSKITSDLCDSVDSCGLPSFHLGGNRDNVLCTHGIHKICFIQYCWISSTTATRGCGFAVMMWRRRGWHTFRRRRHFYEAEQDIENDTISFEQPTPSTLTPSTLIFFELKAALEFSFRLEREVGGLFFLENGASVFSTFTVAFARPFLAVGGAFARPFL